MIKMNHCNICNELYKPLEGEDVCQQCIGIYRNQDTDKEYANNYIQDRIEDDDKS